MGIYIGPAPLPDWPDLHLLVHCGEGPTHLASQLGSPKLLLQKGHALAEKACARTDFSYIPGHLGEF